MKIIVEQSALAKATARVSSIVERRNTIPILSNLLIDASYPGEVWLLGTDLDMEIRTRLEAQIETEGQTTVGANALGEIARNAPKGSEISITLDDAKDPRLQVRFGRSRYQLPVLLAGDFPIFSTQKQPTELSIPAAELAVLLARIHFAQSTEETRYYLNGAYLTKASVSGAPVLRMVATDGHRLALDECSTPASDPMPGVIIPRKTIGEFRRLLDGLAGSVILRVSTASVVFEADGVRLTSKVIDGAYPDYERVIPRDWKHQIVLERDALRLAVKRVSLISAEKTRPVKLAISGGVLTLIVRNMEAGEAREEIEIEDEGLEFETGINARYILDALDQTEGRQVVLRLPEDNTSPCRLDPHPSDSTATGALCVLMPLRV